MSRRERLRWRVAYALGKLSWFCWADLVSWAQQRRSDRYGTTLRETTDRTAQCRAEGAAQGACYCGKFGLAARDAGNEWVIVAGIGGTVCSTCGTPTESEPCAEHQPWRYSQIDQADPWASTGEPS